MHVIKKTCPFTYAQRFLKNQQYLIKYTLSMGRKIKLMAQKMVIKYEFHIIKYIITNSKLNYILSIAGEMSQLNHIFTKLTKRRDKISKVVHFFNLTETL